MICFGLLVMICQPLDQPKIINSYCQIARPIYWSPKDTRRSKEQIDTHNRQWKAVCKRAEREAPNHGRA